jgi:hypothetical protein
MWEVIGAGVGSFMAYLLVKVLGVKKESGSTTREEMLVACNRVLACKIQKKVYVKKGSHDYWETYVPPKALSEFYSALDGFSWYFSKTREELKAKQLIFTDQNAPRIQYDSKGNAIFPIDKFLLLVEELKKDILGK